MVWELGREIAKAKAVREMNMEVEVQSEAVMMKIKDHIFKFGIQGPYLEFGSLSLQK